MILLYTFSSEYKYGGYYMMDILLVDDETRMLELVALYLTPRGYNCICVTSGQEALSYIEKQNFKFILLDIMMPKMDGWETCKRIRSFSNVPIIMVTARDQTIDVVQGLKIGADDYITKPFQEEELLARIEAVLRRSNQHEQLRYKGILWDEARHFISVYDQELLLTPIEFSLIGLFLHHVNYVLSRDQLIERIWGLDTNTEDRTVDSHIRNLRDKLRKANFPIDKHLKTVYGIGYRWIDIEN
ncbi:response regulator transcription factor [Bacillus arachidis]|uniref:Response regulator transcription factor n=1 Tax=Bacillus arachidis TaxID=2819290 RepID=A0ABS3P1K3_9BACI|nr:response regulator transcription factor [Bacillus arachidis]MBO1626930.1 response regulator transcription factor [Bacillus arachidis]